MQLLIDFSYIRDVMVFRCRGCIVCGAEAQCLEQKVRERFQETRDVVLQLSGVERIDSAGIGLLVRLMAAARSGGGDVKLASPPESVRKLLHITKLRHVFEIHDSEQQAIAAFSVQARTASSGGNPGPRILCVDPSPDVLAFLRTVLDAAQYQPLTTDNISDAKVLLKAGRTQLIIFGPNVEAGHAAQVTTAAAPTVPRLALSDDFQHDDPARAGAALLERIRSALAQQPKAPAA